MAKQTRKPCLVGAKKTPAKKAVAAKKPAPPAAKEIDWASVKLALETTARTLDDIGAQYGVTKGRISQKMTAWKAEGWAGRGSLHERVRAKAEARIAAADAHAAKVQAGTEEAEDASAVMMANTILRQRRDVGRLIRLADGLATDLEQENAKPKDAKAKREPVAQRIDNLRKLGDTVTRLITLERNVLGITPDTPVDPTKRVAEAVESGLAGLRQAFAKHLSRAQA